MAIFTANPQGSDRVLRHERCPTTLKENVVESDYGPTEMSLQPKKKAPSIGSLKAITRGGGVTD